MDTISQKTPWTSYAFIMLLGGGILLLLLSLFILQDDSLISGIRQIGIGCVLIGLGEWINHPRQKAISVEGEKDISFSRFFHRQRNPSTGGNLLEIAGLLLLFTGIATYL